MENTYLKALGLILVALIGASITGVAMPVMAWSVPATQAEEDKPWWAKLNLTFDEAVALAWTVRNETYPLFIWANNYLSEYNITIAEKLLERGDYFLEKAYNLSETNETLATGYAFVAALFYGRAPVTAYIVLGKTIRENLGTNNTLTNESVIAVIEKATELKGLLDNATKVAEDYNVTVPDIVFLLEAKGVSELNLSQQLLEEGYLGLALRSAIRGYHLFVRAYGVLIKATFAYYLGIDITVVHRLSQKITTQRVDVQERVQKVLERLPEHVREKIMERWRERRELGPEAIKEAVRQVVCEYKAKLKNISIEQTTRILVRVIIVARALPGDTGLAIQQWMRAKGLVTPKQIYNYIKVLVNKTCEEYNVTGILLINKTLEVLSQEIKNTTGIEVDLVHVFYVLIVVHVATHHKHHP
ncbi:hypothetical protein J4526_07245 [Desulfurococcaceae archaeon MEX13E-LK6-19]|nr:hypothetical protein J4526_07245 [Desulfurococcaceae archaeon MEX13E-LK6-19]